MDDIDTRVAEWLERYSDSGIVPAFRMLVTAALVSILFVMHPAIDAHAKDVFIKVVGTPWLLAALHLSGVVVYTQGETTKSNFLVTFVTFIVDVVEWLLTFPKFFNEFASDCWQMLLFIFGVFLVLEYIPATEASKAMGRSGAGKVKFPKRWMPPLVVFAFFVMPFATYMAFVAWVVIKCLGIIQVIRGMNWFNSTERTCKAPKAKTEKKKNNPEVFKLYKTTTPQKLWNVISDKDGMDYDVITKGCHNNQERVEALLPEVEKFFTVERIETTSPGKKK